MNFIKVNFAGEDSDSDDDPSHINQILAKESVNEVLDTIAKLREYSINRSENDLNMLFSVKVNSQPYQPPSSFNSIYAHRESPFCC